MVEDRLRRLNRSLLAEPSQIEKARELAALCARRPAGIQGTILEGWLAELGPYRDFASQLAALRRLVQLGPMAAFALPALLRLRRSCAGIARRLANDCLYGLGAEALPYFLEALDATDPELRLLGIDRLIATKQAGRHVGRLLKMFEDEDARVRKEAIRAVGRTDLDRDEVVAALKRRVSEDEDGDNRRVALAVLGRASAVGPFLRGVFETEEDCGLKAEAVGGLRRFPEEAARVIPALVEALHRCGHSGRDRCRCRLRSGAERVLSELGEAARPDVWAVLDSDIEALRAAALRLLAGLSEGEGELMALFARRLRGDASAAVRLQALRALTDRAPEASAPLRLLACFDEDGRVRAEAWSSLEEDGLALDAPPEGCDAELYELLRERAEECRERGHDPYRSFLREGFLLCPGCLSWNAVNPGLAWWEGFCRSCGRELTICVDRPRAWESASDDGLQAETPARIKKPRARGGSGGGRRNPWRARGRARGIRRALSRWGEREAERLRRAGRRAWFAVPILIEALREPKLRSAACRALASEAFAEADRGAAVPELALILDEGRPDERAAAVRALGAIGVRAIPELIRALEIHDRGLRRDAAEALAELGAEARLAAPRIRRAFDPWWDRSFIDAILSKLKPA